MLQGVLDRIENALLASGQTHGAPHLNGDCHEHYPISVGYAWQRTRAGTHGTGSLQAAHADVAQVLKPPDGGLQRPSGVNVPM